MKTTGTSPDEPSQNELDILLQQILSWHTTRMLYSKISDGRTTIDDSDNPSVDTLLNAIRYSLLICCLLISPQILATEQYDLPDYSIGYDASRNPNADGRAALKLAKETNRRVLIEVGGDWCSWCHILDRFIRDHPTVQSRLHETFVVLKVNVSDANDNASFMASLPPTLGYPHMYVADMDGSILHSQDTAEFIQNKHYSEQRILAFLDRWQLKHDK
ncbi:MAG: DUF255 domain-containing protein [Gammaproteobacteria bacterium]|nr:MAG: DUF255 domain-containing protein [Gammaproteobacteria bacterium]